MLLPPKGLISATAWRQEQGASFPSLSPSSVSLSSSSSSSRLGGPCVPSPRAHHEAWNTQRVCLCVCAGGCGVCAYEAQGRCRLPCHGAATGSAPAAQKGFQEDLEIRELNFLPQLLLSLESLAPPPAWSTELARPGEHWTPGLLLLALSPVTQFSLRHLSRQVNRKPPPQGPDMQGAISLQPLSLFQAPQGWGCSSQTPTSLHLLYTDCHSVPALAKTAFSVQASAFLHPHGLHPTGHPPHSFPQVHPCPLPSGPPTAARQMFL